MLANTYRFIEHWWIPEASPDEVYQVISFAAAAAMVEGYLPRISTVGRVDRAACR